MEELIKPNWHIAIVHFPIALITLGALLELFSFLGWRRLSLRVAGRWMLLAGAIFAVPAAFSGIYALGDVAPKGINAIRADDPVLADRLFTHLWVQSAATVLAMLIVSVWIGLSDRWRDRLVPLFKLGLVALVCLILFGSHIGGEQVYENQLGTEKKLQPTTLPSVGQLGDWKTWNALFPAEQNHVVIAGLAMAAACVCLGLAARATHFEAIPTTPGEQFARVFPGSTASIGIVGDPYVPYVSPINHTPYVRAGRLWMLAWVIVVLTSLSGLAILAIENGNVDPKALWTSITYVDVGDPQFTRRLVHGIVGTVIVVDTLFLAILSRFARRRATVLAMFSLLLILAMAAQIWLGVLLLLDGSNGPITRFVN